MKSMKTIFGVLAAASLLFSVNVFAQENANVDENGNVVRGPYETTAFGDNWFIGLGLGANDIFNTANGPKIPFFTVPGLDAQITAGKWISPEYGFRLRAQGVTEEGFKNFEFFGGVDVLFNLTYLIKGYKETGHSWSVYPSAGLNLMDGNPAWALGAGFLYNLPLENLFNSNKFNFFVDLNARVVATKEGYDFIVNHADYDGTARGKIGRFSFPLAAVVGLSYNLGNTGFKRHSSVVPAIIPVPFTTQQYEDLSGKVAELEKENAELKDKIAALENEVAPLRQLVNGQTYLYDNGTFTAVDAAAGAPVTLYFDCGSTTLSAREKAHFEYFAKNVVNENTKLSVNGYADKQTGSAKRNQYLSEQRVKTVVDLLKKAGAAEENIETAAHGASVQPFDSAAKNRVVTIEVK